MKKMTTEQVKELIAKHDIVSYFNRRPGTVVADKMLQAGLFSDIIK